MIPPTSSAPRTERNSGRFRGRLDSPLGVGYPGVWVWVWFFVPVDFVHRASRSYYLFFNYLSYYLYVLPVWYKNRGGVLPVWYKTTLFRVTRLVLENSPASLAPVDKPRGGGRPGHRKKAPGTTFSGAETLEDARDSRGRQGRALRF